VGDLSSIVDRVALALGPVAGEPVPLEGGITNRNFRVRFGQREYVVRVPGANTALLGISRESERLAADRAAQLGLAPPVAYGDEACLVTEYIAATASDPPPLADDPAPVARALRSFHQSGVELPTRFWVPELLESYVGVVPEPPADLGRARALAERIARAVPLEGPAPCHNDLLPGNVLAVDSGVRLVDWEYAGMGHPLFDLGNLAVNNEFDPPAEDGLLAAYFEHEPSDRLRAALRLMRIMSDIREAAWGVVQNLVSEIEFDFVGYAARHFERMTRAAEDPCFEEWLGAAAA
jgi:thiamine kinase-like enzyme